MSQITTHVLDTTRGLPASSLPITLCQLVNGQWQQLAGGETNSDGRIAGLLADDLVLAAGTYRMHFDTNTYFELQQEQGFYPYVDIVFDGGKPMAWWQCLDCHGTGTEPLDRILDCATCDGTGDWTKTGKTR